MMVFTKTLANTSVLKGSLAFLPDLRPVPLHVGEFPLPAWGGEGKSLSILGEQTSNPQVPSACSIPCWLPQ